MMNTEWNKSIAGLYDDKELMDCKFVFKNGKPLPAHKWILAAQSPVLRDFSTSTKTKAGEVVTVYVPDEFTAETVDAVIHYCYHGFVDPSVKMAEAIFKLADHYGMSDLREAVRVGFSAELSSKYPVDTKEKRLSSFIDTNQSILRTAKWAMGKGRRELAEELSKSVTQWEWKKDDRSREGMMARRNRNIFLLCNYGATVDCWIQAGDKRFPAHRCILMAHSLHFRQYFSHFFTNPAAGGLETGIVHEMTLPEAVFDVLIYCYFGGFIPQEEELAVPMFELAAKYLMDGMRSRMEKRFIAKLSVANVLKMLVLANSHLTTRPLKKACIEYIAKEESVMEGAEWEELEREKPALADNTRTAVNSEREERRRMERESRSTRRDGRGRRH